MLIQWKKIQCDDVSVVVDEDGSVDVEDDDDDDVEDGVDDDGEAEVVGLDEVDAGYDGFGRAQ